VIKDICRDIISTFDKEKLMSILLNAVTNLLYTDRVAVALLDETTHKEYYIHHGIGIDLVKKRTLRFKKNEGLAYHLGNKKEILIKNELVRNKMSNVHWRELIRDFEKIDAQVCAPLLVKDKLIGMVLLHEKVSGERYQEEDIQILYILTNYASIALENIYTYYKQLKGFVNVIQRLIIMLEAKDKYFHGHCKRVSAYSTAIAQELGLNNNIVNMTGIAGILHDIGNISVSEQVLQKPGRLNKGEFENIKQHAMIGTMIVEPMGLEKEIVDSIKYHHERLDGSGYPVGLTDKEIPLIAKIIAVADVFDAMTSKRPYRKAFSREDAIIELKRRCGYEFDESVVDAFITILTKDTARRYVRKR
jgi:putative nucleotidyltransferase with HDIG domain